MNKAGTQTEWNLTALAASDNDPVLADRLADNSKAVEAFCQKWRQNEAYTKDAIVLKQALDDYEELQRLYGYNSWQSYYFSLRQAQSQTDDEVRRQSRLADEKAITLYNQLQFFTLSLINIEPNVQGILLKSPELKTYHYFLERLFAEKKHVLSEAEERILNLMSQPAARSWIDMTETFLAGVSRSTLINSTDRQDQNLPQLMALINHKSKPVRDEAATHVNQVMSEYAAVATEEMNALLAYKKITDDLRGFERADAARHMSDGVETAMVDTLIESVTHRNNLARDYYGLKAKLMGQDRLAYHERNVEYGEIEVTYSYADAITLIDKVFSSLDPEFSQITRAFIDNGQIDVYPRPGKTGGAFCAGSLLTQPSYILLNHTDRLQDVLTMAHELGHGINNELSRARQNSLNFGMSLATAEVASTFMEDFVLEELLVKADDVTRLAIMMMKLNDDVSSIFRQVACYRFEQALHTQYRQNGYLSTATIGQLFSQHMADYMGSAVEQPELAANWWVYWSHIRNSFYVYSYASGLLISKSLQRMVNQDPASIKQVKQFLEAGTSQSPSKIFSSIGLDIEQPAFWQKGLDQIEDLLNKTNQLASKLKLI